MKNKVDKDVYKMLEECKGIYMVSTPNGVCMKGKEEMIWSLLTGIFKALRERYTEEEIGEKTKYAIELSGKTREEIEKEALKVLKDMLKSFCNMED